ncbi:hypothetical protein JQF37_16890 [Pseudomonas sp. MIL9]|nr:hypothetical protein [Pseudomonas sp. MIL9]
MTNQHSNAAQQPPTHQERFAEACMATDFAVDERSIGGYTVWDVQHLSNGVRVTIDGPFFTEDEARVSADLLRGTFRGARAYQSTHCSAWNPDPLREKAIRERASLSRAALARQLGIDAPEVPK